MNDNDDDDSRWKSALIELLFDKSLCSSLEESQAIVESIAEEREDHRDDGDGNSPGMETEIKEWNHALQEYLGISVEESQQIMDQCRATVSTSNGDGEQDDDEDTHEDPEEDDNDGDGENLGPGECELCERFMRLTRHHLIPKSTWPRMEVKLQHDWQAWCQNPAGGSEWIQLLIAQESLDKARSSSKADQETLHSKTIRSMFKYHACQVCRPCHTAIHKFHDNMTLAQHYYTTELLLQDQQVYKFCQWANKQRAGKHAVT
jgi:hypothetical protein